MRTLRGVCVLAGALTALSAQVLADGVDGKKVYDTRCAFCHGVEGRGDGPAGAALKPPATNFSVAGYAKSASLEKIKDTIAQGRQGTAMIAFGKTLKPEELDAVSNYLLQHLAGK